MASAFRIAACCGVRSLPASSAARAAARRSSSVSFGAGSASRGTLGCAESAEGAAGGSGTAGGSDGAGAGADNGCVNGGVSWDAITGAATGGCVATGCVAAACAMAPKPQRKRDAVRSGDTGNERLLPTPSDSKVRPAGRGLKREVGGLPPHCDRVSAARSDPSRSGPHLAPVHFLPLGSAGCALEEVVNWDVQARSMTLGAWVDV